MKPQIKQLITEYAGECSNCKKLSNDLLDLHSKWLSDRQFLDTQMSELKAENEALREQGSFWKESAQLNTSKAHEFKAENERFKNEKDD